ncbi:MAG TPA: DUF664 domain-containing protein [Streptosporangiaceae bacterium]|nr:DUF664 domain-containing protein [Streptosporangiaceae bacterium]
MSEPFPEATTPASSRSEVFLRYLDYFRSRVTAKLADLRDQAERSRAIIASHDLDDVGQPSERWDGADPATLERVLFHLLQEYARHLGQLDVVLELATGLSEE